jgi:hypothetical protein
MQRKENEGNRKLITYFGLILNCLVSFDCICVNKRHFVGFYYTHF